MQKPTEKPLKVDILFCILFYIVSTDRFLVLVEIDGIVREIDTVREGADEELLEPFYRLAWY